MTIKQTDPLAGYLERKAEIDAAIATVLSRGQYLNGSEVSSFESELAAFLGAPHIVGVASGTDALQLALRTLDIGRGDQVVTVSHTAVATVAAIELAGAEPLLVDIDSASFTLSPQRLSDVLQKGRGRIKAVIAVHLYGHPADMISILEIAQRHQLRVIEDCAQAHGAAIGDRLVGSFGDLAAFSFYPTKNLGAFGDGGALAVQDGALAERARCLREYGWKERHISHLAGMNSRLDELQAAVLRVKLRHLEADNQRRRAIAAIYDAALHTPSTRSGVRHCYHQYVIRSSRRDELRLHLQKEAIATAVHYPEPVHLQPAYRGRIATAGALHESEAACREVLSLPMYPQLPIGDAERVCAAIARFDSPPTAR